MARATAKLKTNIPMVGTIAKAYYNPPKGEYAANVGLVGMWDGTDAAYYATMNVVEQLTSMGILEAYDYQGEPRYKVLDDRTAVEVLKEEDPDDARKKRITVSLADGARTASPARGPATSRTAAAPTPSVRSYWKRQTLTMQRAWKAAQWVLWGDEDVEELTGDQMEITEKMAVALYIQANRDGMLVDE